MPPGPRELPNDDSGSGRRDRWMFYKLNASRVTIREFWWETRLFFWVGIIVKLLRIRLRGSSDDLAVDSLGPFLVDRSQIAPEALQQFGPTLRQLQSLGFGEPTWHDQEDVFQGTRSSTWDFAWLLPCYCC